MSLTGWEANRTALYEQLDIVCLTSHNEGTPVALIEALAAARAVIATEVGGVRELLGEPVSDPLGLTEGFSVHERGLLVAPDDSEGFARGVAWLLTHGGARRRLGDAGRAFVMQRYHFGQLEQRMCELYAQLLPNEK